MTPDLRPVVFADLDDTLFQTVAKMTEPPCETRLASVATNGKHSYMTEAQAATVAWLLETTRLIPTTARSSDVLARTTLPFRDFRICSNGGAILDPDGAHDPDWAKHAARVSAAHTDIFSALQDSVVQKTPQHLLRSWFVLEQGIPIYFVVKINEETDAEVLDDAEAICRETVGDKLVFHRNGRNMSFTPAGLTKIDSVKEVLGRLSDRDRRPIWGMGDSLSDLPFMRLCQMIVAPTGSQIGRTRLKE